MENVVDCIYFGEYCNWVIDEEFVDGCMVWDMIKEKGIEGGSFKEVLVICKNIWNVEGPCDRIN